jgi:hypothetical protein
MERLKVIQWTTGKVGKMALRGIFDDPRLELVGVYAHSKDKIGEDAGTISGRLACGVVATDDVEALVALGADAVVYAPYMADLAHLVRLLETGTNVISTNLLVNLGGLTGEVRNKLDAACERGGTSLYITGINPGWLDTLAAAVTSVCRRIDTIEVTESVSVAHYESADTWRRVGMSMPAATPEVMESARSSLLSFRDNVTRLAAALEVTLDSVEFDVEYAGASDALDLGWFRIEKGSHAALRGGWDGKIEGRTVISYRVVWYMTKDLDRDWDIDQHNYLVDVSGEPDISLRVRVKTPQHWANVEHAIVTAMPAVNAISQVVAAKSGILGLKDAGLPAAPVGVWLGLSQGQS